MKEDFFLEELSKCRVKNEIDEPLHNQVFVFCILFMVFKLIRHELRCFEMRKNENKCCNFIELTKLFLSINLQMY